MTAWKKENWKIPSPPLADYVKRSEEEIEKLRHWMEKMCCRAAGRVESLGCPVEKCPIHETCYWR